MKLPTGSYLITALIGVSMLAAGCATGPTGEVAQTSAANRVLESYKIGDLLGQAAPAVASSLSRNLPASVAASERTRLQNTVNKAYDADDLRSQVIDRLKARAARSGHKTDLAAAAGVLEKPLVRRMIRLQTKVTEPDFAQGFKQFVSRPAGAQRQRRLSIINQINADMRVTELQTGFNMTLLESMLRARNAAADASQRVDANRMQKILSNTRDGIRAKLAEQVPQMLLYVYRSVDTATLARYAGYQHQPAMVWTNQALEKAIVQTLADASQNIPKTYANKE